MPTYRLVSLKREHGFIGEGIYVACITDLGAESFVYTEYVTLYILCTASCKCSDCHAHAPNKTVSSQACQNWELLSYNRFITEKWKNILHRKGFYCLEKQKCLVFCI